MVGCPEMRWIVIRGIHIPNNKKALLRRRAFSHLFDFPLHSMELNGIEPSASRVRFSKFTFVIE